MRTYIKAYTSLNFGQIPLLTTELAALEHLKNRCHHVISVDIDPIFFKLAGNKTIVTNYPTMATCGVYLVNPASAV